MLIQLLKILWVRWKAFGRWLATIQSRALLFLFYYVVVAPFALGVKRLSDPLAMRPTTPAGWRDRPSSDGDPLVLARRQF